MASVAIVNGRLAFPLPFGTDAQVENGTLYFWTRVPYELSILVSQSMSISVQGQAQAEEAMSLSQIMSMAFILPIITPDSRTFTIRAETRTMSVPSETRELTIDAENRTLLIT